MAKAPSKKSETTVTRIVAADSSRSSEKKATKDKKPTKVTETKVPKEKHISARKNPFLAIAAYFKGSWYELRQVRWPDRRATWGMTGALILFTLFFVVLILLLDFGFGQLFKLMTGKA